MKYEYTLIHCLFGELAERLNEYGLKGWRVVQILPVAPNTIPDNSWWLLLERCDEDRERWVRRIASNHLRDVIATMQANTKRQTGDHRPPHDLSPSG